MSQPILYASHEPDPESVNALFRDVEDVFTQATITEPFADGYDGEVEPIDIEMRDFLGESAIAGAFMANQQAMYRALGEIMNRHEQAY